MLYTKDYTIEETLRKAIQYEHDCEMLAVVKQEIVGVENKLERYSLCLDRLNRELSRLEKSISNFQEAYSEGSV